LSTLRLINDSEQGPLLKTPAASRLRCVCYSGVISYSNSRATFYCKLVQRKDAVS